MDDAARATVKAAWSDYLDSLKPAADQLFRSSTPGAELTVAEGLRHLSRLTRLGLLATVEFADPDFPVLARYVDEVTKFGCDNPDTIYQRAVINGRHRYRISGLRNTIDYLSFITAKTDADGRQERVGQVDTTTLVVDPDGTFQITLSPEPNGPNWLRLSADTQSVSVRQTYLDRSREVAAALTIERLDTTDTPAPVTLDRVTSALQAASAYTRYCATLFTDWTESYLAHPNELPAADQEACLRAGGDPNIYFYRSFWQLEPDQALVIRIPRIPTCETWNLQVDNYWQESMDYRYHRSHLNRHSAVADADGGITAVVAHRNPGHPNWLDTAGHGEGHFAMRWIGASEHVDPITQVVPFEQAPR